MRDRMGLSLNGSIVSSVYVLGDPHSTQKRRFTAAIPSKMGMPDVLNKD
ncbi:hypothetical protein ACIRQY_29155 [Streptomyces sp. NPDC101490]